MKNNLIKTFTIVFTILLLVMCKSQNSNNNNSADKKGLQKLKYNDPDLIVDLGVGLWAWSIPTDYDGDGDYDLLVSCTDKPYNGVYFFENVEGNVKMPTFKSGVRISKGYKNIQPSYIDGKLRLLIPGKEILNLQEEKIVDIYPKEIINSTAKRIRAKQWKYCDYNGDNTLDLIVSEGNWTDYGWDNAFDKNGKWKNGPLHGNLYFIKNINTNESPKYAEPKLIYSDNSPIDVYGMPSANFEDFDNDGDLDIICGEFLDKFSYFENIGDRKNPKYTSRGFLTNLNKPITMDLEMIVPVAIDWDKDGDID
ncbi:MAG: VCBS repeat-containing protein, partial [Chlorobi bacterium]|nr:VCBS repeat-containing protein [Chlorobiota bacterium]